MRGRTTLILAHRLSSVIELGPDPGAGARPGRRGRPPRALMARKGAYHRLMAEQADSAAGREIDPARAGPSGGAWSRQERAAGRRERPEDAILRAEGLGWGGGCASCWASFCPGRAPDLTFLFGVGRVAAFIGVGVVSALAVAAVKTGAPVAALLVALLVLAPAAGLLHWLESWIAHDMAFRLLAGCASSCSTSWTAWRRPILVRRRTGDLVSMATHDVELVEYFFAHTIAPAFVAVLVPAAVVATLLAFDWRLAAALAPFLRRVGLSPFLLRGRIDRLASRVPRGAGRAQRPRRGQRAGPDRDPGLPAGAARARDLPRAACAGTTALRLPFFRELTLQTAFVEV